MLALGVNRFLYEKQLQWMDLGRDKICSLAISGLLHHSWRLPGRNILSSARAYCLTTDTRSIRRQANAYCLGNEIVETLFTYHVVCTRMRIQPRNLGRITSCGGCSTMSASNKQLSLPYRRESTPLSKSIARQDYRSTSEHQAVESCQANSPKS